MTLLIFCSFGRFNKFIRYFLGKTYIRNTKALEKSSAFVLKEMEHHPDYPSLLLASDVLNWLDKTFSANIVGKSNLKHIYRQRLRAKFPSSAFEIAALPISVAKPFVTKMKAKSYLAPRPIVKIQISLEIGHLYNNEQFNKAMCNMINNSEPRNLLCQIAPQKLALYHIALAKQWCVLCRGIPMPPYNIQPLIRHALIKVCNPYRAPCVRVHTPLRIYCITNLLVEFTQY